MTSSVLETPAPLLLEDGLRKWRIQRTIDDPFEFGRIYFPKYWFQSSPDFHRDIIDLATHRNEEEWQGKENLNTLVIAAPRNHSKCLSKDTKILLSNGNRVSIQDIEVGQEIISLNQSTLLFETDTIVAKVDSGVKNILRLQTRTGNVIRLTPEHRILTFEGWKEAREITIKDRIASPRRVPCLQSNQESTVSEVRLLAYLIAEGSLTEPTSIRFTNQDTLVVEDFKTCANSMGFNVSRITSLTWSLRTGVNSPLRWTRHNNIQGHSALTKKIPEWIFGLSVELKWQFLDALMVTDGFFAKQAGQGGITLANEALIDQIKELFTQVGIICSKRFVKNNKSNAWTLLFGAEYIQIMLQNCNLFHKRQAAEYIINKSDHNKSFTDAYPNSIKKILINSSRYFRSLQIRVDNKYDITKSKLSRMISVCKSNPSNRNNSAVSVWERYENADIFWDSVVSIQNDGEEQTFDVEVKNNGNIISNGLITHNSTLITFLYVIWSLVTQRKFFVVIISDIARISTSHSRNIKEEFEMNEKLVNDWGIVLGRDWDKFDGAARGEKEKWTDEEFVIGFRKWDKINNKWGNELEDRAKILARMANNPLRGLRFGFRRPDLVIADDLENDELVDTSIQRQKLASWWDSAVEPMIEPPPVGQIILVGTVLHYGSLLNQMLARPDLYVTRRYQAIITKENEEGIKVQMPLWPERFSLERLRAIRAKNVLAFQKEYMNDPRDDTTRTFRSSWIQWYDANDLGYRPVSKKWYFRGKPLTFFTGVDWTVGKDDASDFFSLIMIGKTPDLDIVVFDIVNQRMDVANQLNRVIQQNQSYPIQMNGIEGNGFQHVLIQQVMRRALLPIREIRHHAKKKKQIRIEGMSPLFEQGKIFLRRCTTDEIRMIKSSGDDDALLVEDETRAVVVHPEFQKFYEQLMTYPRSENDDMLDALEMSLEVSRNTRKMFDEVLMV
jgi:intein/homing endonuclease/phage terminase large subunit-like protein